MEAAADGTISEAERADLAGHVDTLIALATRLRAVLGGPAALRSAA